ncbi:unnamed protein product, partial [marine sediment metagenome]
ERRVDGGEEDGQIPIERRNYIRKGRIRMISEATPEYKPAPVRGTSHITGLSTLD